MTPSRRNLLVGSVVLVGLIGLAWMILRFSSTSAASLFSKGITVHLEGKRADGVSEGSPVFYLGVNVGRVLTVRRLTDKPGVMIDVSIDSKQPLPGNVRGIIRQQSPLSNAAAINFEPEGDPSTKLLADGDVREAVYEGGGVIPPEFTEVATRIRKEEVIEHIREVGKDSETIDVIYVIDSEGVLLDDHADPAPVRRLIVSRAVAAATRTVHGKATSRNSRKRRIDRESFMPGVLLAVRRVGELPERFVVGLENLL